MKKMKVRFIVIAFTGILILGRSGISAQEKPSISAGIGFAETLNCGIKFWTGERSQDLVLMKE